MACGGIEVKNILRGFDARRDLEAAYRIFMDYDSQYLFHSAFRIDDIGAFERWLLSSIGQNFMAFQVIADESDRLIGIVYAYDYRPHDGHCKLCTALAPEYIDSGVGGFATLRFLDQLFRYYPLGKVFLTVYDYNRKSLENNFRAGFEEEAVLREYRYYDGNRWDLHVLSVSREDFYARFSEILKKHE